MWLTQEEQLAVTQMEQDAIVFLLRSSGTHCLLSSLFFSALFSHLSYSSTKRWISNNLQRESVADRLALGRWE
ncbi:uncharacterized protein [Blastocystis hominis]|uniref:Uncharacterized protein n=1 Tax=Blastocystis hominis TaxID=12968 RepID=D8LWY0_BLAHO|nr:uncharacterized protein [Blastocystis hominis]CBK20775.2 unnamed protein product [Blastocystis hominis]|eukprot:XP_012894823.1 uncharacterized protein [Blastocystis hominis]